ncbi:hypothetical protein CRUP_035275 [Coryphaenoides rupestris]|nr:hypothetical protein CRUP_035275 [Coryphaenoides rupestris]
MAAAATLSASVTGKNKPHNNKEHVRRNRENSRRRQAALLFLSNISLDGRPVQSNVAPESTDYEGNDLGSPSVTVRLSPVPTGGYGTFHGLSASASCTNVNPPATPRIGLLHHVPPILVLPSDSGFDDIGTGAGLLERRTASFSTPGNLLSPSPSSGSLLPSPVGPRKSSTLLSVHSCNSVSSEPRQRPTSAMTRETSKEGSSARLARHQLNQADSDRFSGPGCAGPKSCYRCGEAGHIARYCPAPAPQHHGPPQLGN